ncbi:MAG: lamin tail domain-containing protein [Candidatus Hydrogenedentes bacterium]|nr:lamin tail domain-containing protein [Candidatus Hydrogenedentota bacterium]
MGYLLFYEDLHFGNPENPDALIPFAFSSYGEAVYLSSGSDGMLTGYRTGEDFGASETGVSFGRYVTSEGDAKFVSMSVSTPGAANAPPRLGTVIMTEIMYNPPSGNQEEEYIELYNTTSVSINLGGRNTVPWRFTNGIEYSFPSGTLIPANGYLIVARNPEAFSAAYTAPAGVAVLGPYGGRLDNAGEGVELSKPASPEEGVEQVFFREDHVRYYPTAPWPPSANGGGDALRRVSTIAFGNDPASWTAGSPTPGAP